MADVLLRSVAESLPFAFFVKDLEGRYVYINAVAAQMAGKTPAEMVGRTDEELFGAQAAAVFRAHDQRAMASATPTSEEERASLYGRLAIYEAIKTAWRGEDGVLLGVAGLSRDVTELRVAEAQLRDVQQQLADSERRHRLLFETMSDGVIFQDADFRMTAANSAALRILGVSLYEVIGRRSLPAEIRVLTEDGEALAIEDMPTAVALREGRPVIGQLMRIERRDWTRRWVLINSIPQFRDGEAAPYQVYTTFTDITRMREAEAAVRASEGRHRALLEHATDLSFVVDADGRMVYASDSFNKLMGYHPGELVGRLGFDFVHPDDIPATEAVLARVVANREEVVTTELRGRHADGHYSIFALTLRNLLDHPDIGGIVVNSRDITEQRAAEQALQQRDEELRHAQKMEAVGRLAGGIAHDFNNVLTAITGHAEFLAEMFDDEHAARIDIDAIRSGAGRAARLTRQLLAFSRKQVMQPTVLDLCNVARETHDVLGRMLGEHTRLDLVIDDAPLLVQADRAHIEEVILHLAVNANDAMPDGGTITLQLSELEVTPASWQAERGQVAPGRYVQLSISDTGTGIPPELLSKIFDPFFTTKGRTAASGLGLSMVYGIVKQSDGHVLVSSEPARGTRFDVLLPYVQPAVEDAPTSVEGGDAVRSDTVLLVEDEASVRLMAERVLRRQGFQVLTAGDGKEALAVLGAQSEPVRVVVTDVVMPHMSGRELAAELARRYPDTRIVFMSGYTDNEITEEGIIAAQAAFLAKPFTPTELAQMVRTAFGWQDN